MVNRVESPAYMIEPVNWILGQALYPVDLKENQSETTIESTLSLFHL